MLPTLKKVDLVIADNLSVHKDAQTQELIASVGAQLVFLPVYSPDLNPIEKMQSKVKQYLWDAKAHTQEMLLQAVSQALIRSALTI